METQKVSELQEITTISTQDSLPILTDEIDNVVDRITIDNLLTNIISTDDNNALKQGVDNKLYIGSAINLYDSEYSYSEGKWVLVNGIIYESKVDDNIGNPVTDSDYWESVSLGGGGAGLEVCDIATALYIDETKGLRRYLNGSTVAINQNTQAFLDRLKEIRTLHPEYFTDEQTWQSEATLNVDGCVYKFVIDEVAGTIRLPKYPEYVEVTKDKLPVIGNGMTLGLTDGTNNFSIYTEGAQLDIGKNSYGQSVGSTRVASSVSNYINSGITTDPTKSGIETSITGVTKLKLRYFIQIATGQETQVDIVNTLELNNPYSFGDCKYTEIELSNLSWLRSNGQWNSKAVYVDYYNWILTNANNNVDKFKKSTDTYTDYDWVVNTSNETFRLPIKTNLASGKAVVGNGLGLGLTNGTVSGSMVGTLSANCGLVLANNQPLGKQVDSTTTISSANIQNGITGITTDATKSGIELSDSNLYLYYYVGETVQNANLIDAGRIQEQLAKFDEWVYWQQGSEGYRYNKRNGYCEQWGRVATTSNNSSVIVTFLKTFKNTSYNTSATGLYPAYNQYTNNTSDLTVSSMKVWANNAQSVNWKACGYLAEGEY